MIDELEFAEHPSDQTDEVAALKGGKRKHHPRLGIRNHIGQFSPCITRVEADPDQTDLYCGQHADQKLWTGCGENGHPLTMAQAQAEEPTCQSVHAL